MYEKCATILHNEISVYSYHIRFPEKILKGKELTLLKYRNEKESTHLHEKKI